MANTPSPSSPPVETCPTPVATYDTDDDDDDLSSIIARRAFVRQTPRRAPAGTRNDPIVIEDSDNDDGPIIVEISDDDDLSPPAKRTKHQ